MAAVIEQPQLLNPTQPESEIYYPECDGQPMADNTKQFRWIVIIKENLELLYLDDPNVFIAGDLLWYPVEGARDIRQAPDAMVVFGRPKGDRGSYRQWKEGGIAPHVVFEIRSPGNRLSEMERKKLFYEEYGVEEYYLYDPDREDASGWIRKEAKFELIPELNGWVSPRLGIQFESGENVFRLFRPDGEPFLTFADLEILRKQAQKRAEAESQRAEAESQRAEAERVEKEQALKRLELLAARLREMGIDPDQL